MDLVTDRVRSACSESNLDAAADSLTALMNIVVTISDSPFDYFQMHLPLIFEESNHKEPLRLALDLAAHPKLRRKAGDKVDLIAMLVRAAAESDPNFAKSIDPALSERAAQLCRRFARVCDCAAFVLCFLLLYCVVFFFL